MSHSVYDAGSWYVVYCLPLKEQMASMRLADQLGLNVYLPQLKRVEGGRAQLTPFFPRYLFIQADLGQVAMSQINATPGVQRLVVLGDTPQPVASAVVEELRRRLAQLNLEPGPPERLQRGSAVRLRSGPLQGLEAVFVEALSPGERVRVLVEFLGRQQTIDIPAAALEPTGGPGGRLPRRTRGKGRTIRVPRQEG